ncbi:glycosyltransferase family 39 protein [Candidatus Woesearchaeota archaeon]|nr:glycosyltransferase family 39 protein [Candidatus Woesearchaeota archaeon]
MKNKHALIIIICIYALSALALNLVFDLTISNSYQRAITAGSIAQLLHNEPGKLTDITALKAYFIDGHAHYKLFSGISDWQPLQVILLTAVFFFFGINTFSILLVPLAITILTLIYLYRLALDNYHRENVATLTILLVGLSTLFLYESASLLLETGITLFTTMTIFYFARYLKSRTSRSFYLAALSLGLGLLYHIQMAFVLPAMCIVFLWKTPLKPFFTTPKNYRMLAIACCIILTVLIPFIVREIVLTHEGISVFKTRAATRVNYLYEHTVTKPGFVTANDFEFQNPLPWYKKELILNRYLLSYLQKAVVTFSAFFFNWILAPLAFFWLFARRKKCNDAELIILLFCITTLSIFTLEGLLPRYVIPAAILFTTFAAPGAYLLPKKVFKPVLALVIAILFIQAGLFFERIYQGEHVQSMQHDYDTTAAYILNTTTGNFTVITTRVYQMAFAVMRRDIERRAYVEMVPFNQTSFTTMLEGNFSTPELLAGTSLPYPTSRPPVRYVIVHEELETGALQGTADYNVRDYLEHYPHANLAKIIPSAFPNATTWIYSIN